MVRPKGESRGLRSAWPTGTFAVLLQVFASAAVAEAAEPLGEPAGIQVAQRADTHFGAEERAQELYLDAMEKLDAGLGGPAQNMLSQLIVKYPETQAATLARRRLGELRGGTVVHTAVGTVTAVPFGAPAAAEPVPVPVNGPVWDQELRRNGVIQARLRVDAGDRVFFGPGSAELGTRARAALAAQAQWLKRWREFEAAIEGHADEAGSQQDDLMLSQQRAEAVRQRLVAEGVAPSRLAVVAQGNTQPVAVCPAPECRAQNRRVVTLVFVGGTNKRLGLNTRPMTESLAEIAVAPSGDAQALEVPVAAEQNGTAR